MPETPIPDAALTTLLDWLIRLDTGAVEQLALRLYKNDFTPQPGSVTADFTECDFGGYSQRPMPRGGFGPATLAAHMAQITLAGSPFEWTPTDSGQTVYGVFVVGQATNNYYSGKRFSTPRVLVAGTPLRLLPLYTLQSVVV